MPPDRRESGTPTWLSIKNSRCNASAHVDGRPDPITFAMIAFEIAVLLRR
jgi:hypothetical protein